MPYKDKEKQRIFQREYMREWNKTHSLNTEQKLKKYKTNKEWSLKNSERLKDYQQQRWLKDKDRIGLRKKDRHLKNPEIRKSQHRKSYLKYRDKILQYSKEYQMINKEAIKRTKKKFRLSPRGRLNSYKQSAKARGYEFVLDYSQFTQILQSDCHYCGVAEANGVDRIDSSTGYLSDNVLPCCKICNYMKNRHSYKFFIDHVKKIVENII